jgi:DNA-binding transcriptional MocR family regulator
MFQDTPEFAHLVRLSYGVSSPETIHEAVRILARILDARLKAG